MAQAEHADRSAQGIATETASGRLWDGGGHAAPCVTLTPDDAFPAHLRRTKRKLVRGAPLPHNHMKRQVPLRWRGKDLGKEMGGVAAGLAVMPLSISGPWL